MWINYNQEEHGWPHKILSNDTSEFPTWINIFFLKIAFSSSGTLISPKENLIFSWYLCRRPSNRQINITHQQKESIRQYFVIFSELLLAAEKKYIDRNIKNKMLYPKSADINVKSRITTRNTDYNENEDNDSVSGKLANRNTANQRQT